MEEVIDISVLIDRLLRNNTTPEELIGQAVKNLYVIESHFLSRSTIDTRDNVRAIIAYAKLLYDFGQQMSLARIYLVHKIKLLEVRDIDLNAEISVLRGQSPPPPRKRPLLLVAS